MCSGNGPDLKTFTKKALIRVKRNATDSIARQSIDGPLLFQPTNDIRRSIDADCLARRRTRGLFNAAQDIHRDDIASRCGSLKHGCGIYTFVRR